ncbi:MAG: hypothetical protein EXX96DRAFT_613834 [Benjaminiella poitrasii]|nr:MAG: hypothetical protein EXX96DRAFT_613834 [Benjaminiella poitrasii]
MCLQSPWTKPIVIACARILVPILYQFLQRQNGEKSICTNRKDNDDLKIYCFEVYHHQRWWFPTGWSKILLPQDYPLWSDIYLEPTPSIHNFRLPPPTLTGKINEKNQQKMTSWVWIDSNWTIYRSDSVADKDSWEYSTWQWKNWSTRSNKFDICTRRQKWYRRAQRKEFWIDMNDSIEESYMCDYSCTTTCTFSLPSSSSSSHSHTSTVVKETCSVTEPVHSNNIVSYDNKGERMFRRLSLNSSNNSSKSFSIQEHNHGLFLIESRAFKKYCKSPKPQKIMKLQNVSVVYFNRGIYKIISLTGVSIKVELLSTSLELLMTGLVGSASFILLLPTSESVEKEE